MGKDDSDRISKKRLGANRLKALGGMPVLLALLVVSTSPFVTWRLLPDNPLRVQVVDKTVAHPTYREHLALFWVLNHFRTKPVTAPRPWTLNRDYIGYYPERLTPKGRAVTEDLAPRHLGGRDILFIADTYGVYTEDLVDPGDYLEALDYSHRIYGGLQAGEVDAIERFTKAGGDLVGEYNTFGSPTGLEERRRMEALFGVTWTEWSGRYFEDLGNETEVPVWARRHYLRHYGTPWDFHGEGWLVTNEDTRLFVLENGKDVGPRGMQLVDVNARDELMKGVYGDVPFRYWFDVLVPHKGADVLASHFIDVTASGKAKMKKFGVPQQFPAVIAASRRPLRLYVAGDVSDMNVPMGMFNIIGIELFKKTGRFYEHKKDQQAFLWEVYVPLFSNILHIQARGK